MPMAIIINSRKYMKKLAKKNKIITPKINSKTSFTLMFKKTT